MLNLLKFIWLLPITIPVWCFYILPLFVFKEIQYRGKASKYVWIFENTIDPASKYDKLWGKWGGWSGPCVMIYKDLKSKKKNKTIKDHELKHCDDQFNFGPLFYPAYGAHSAWILVSNHWKDQKDRKHAHKDNFFEKRARRTAGQRVDIPQSEWPEGPKDYNPWI